MLIEQLDEKRPDYDAGTWAQYDALYRAGKAFRALIGEFLPKNELEPPGMYLKRKKAAHYRSYVGPITNFFAAGMFTSPPVVRSEPDAPPFYADFAKNCDGNRLNVVDFMRERFTTSLVKGEAWWMVCLPKNDTGVVPQDRGEWQELGLDRPYLCAVAPEDVYDFERDDRGQLLWLLTHSIERPRASLSASRGRIVETWRCYDRENVTTYRAEYDAKRRPKAGTEIEQAGPPVKHGFSRVPFVELRPPDGMWLLDLVADAQIEHFQLDAGLGWAIRRTCYAMMFICRDKNTGEPTVGPGYWLDLSQKDEVGYAAPDGGSFSVIADKIAVQKDEIYRITNQMALGVENNAAAVGRSAESKEEDASAAETCLTAYASPVRESVEVTYGLLAEGRGEESKWTVEGLDKFKIADAARELEAAASAKLLAVPSKTFKVELYRKAVDGYLPRVDASTRDKILKEIEDGVEDELDAEALLKEHGGLPGTTPTPMGARVGEDRDGPPGNRGRVPPAPPGRAPTPRA